VRVPARNYAMASSLLHNLFDQLAKRIRRAVYARAGVVESQHEVAGDAQQIDTLFRLNPALAPELDGLGLLGRMIDGPKTVFEAFHEALSVDDYRDCVRKQLTADHVDVLAAKAKDDPRPPFPRMWLLVAGRPKTVIRGYGLEHLPSFPEAFLEGQPEERVRLVVLPELPPTRDTLLLRLMAAGDVLRAALAELARLPEDAWERRIAMPPLLALRMEIPHDSTDPDEREYLMNGMELYEQWERQVRREGAEQGVKKGLEQGVKKGLVKLYRARFGEMPPAIAAAVEAMHDPGTLDRWLDLFEVKSADEIAAALSAR
jgi:hypothetical protein